MDTGAGLVKIHMQVNPWGWRKSTRRWICGCISQLTPASASDGFWVHTVMAIDIIPKVREPPRLEERSPHSTSPMTLSWVLSSTDEEAFSSCTSLTHFELSVGNVVDVLCLFELVAGVSTIR